MKLRPNPIPQQLDTLFEAAMAVLEFQDCDARSYEAQTPVEDWTLEALSLALGGQFYKARLLLEKYAKAEWEVRKTFEYGY